MSDALQVLVTGGAGFLGTPVVKKLLARGCHVTLLDDFSVGRRPRPHDSLTIAEGDIRDADFVTSVVESHAFSHVFHLAALHYIPLCDADPKAALMTNVVGTRNLVEALKRHKRLRLFVFASTMAVYAPSDDAHNEAASQTVPMDVYGWTKLVGEDLIRAGCLEAGWPALCCRLSNLVGPGETNPHLFPEVARQIGCGANRIEVGNLTPRRNYIHVDDVADLMAQIVERPTSGFEIVNVGSDEECTVEQILEKFRRLSGGAVDFISVLARQRQVDRPRLQPDTSRMRRLLGTPSRSIDQAVREALSEQMLRA